RSSRARRRHRRADPAGFWVAPVCDSQVGKCRLRAESSRAARSRAADRQGIRHMNPHRTTIQVASILLFSAGVAVAQTPGTPSPPPADQPAATEPTVPTSAPPTTERRQTVTEELVVTGSRIRRKDLTTPAPVTVVTREQFESSGRMTIGDYLQTMPEQGNAPNFQLNTGGINYGADGTTRINLRSLGIQRTLVLINGRRVVP